MGLVLGNAYEWIRYGKYLWHCWLLPFGTHCSSLLKQRVKVIRHVEGLMKTTEQHRWGFVRYVFLTIGAISLEFGTAGIVLPLL